jgi:hypothetical protein
MQLYHDQDADLTFLDGWMIAVTGYGNEGCAQVLSLQDSGREVIVGNREDDHAERARSDEFSGHPIVAAVGPTLGGVLATDAQPLAGDEALCRGRACLFCPVSMRMCGRSVVRRRPVDGCPASFAMRR